MPVPSMATVSIRTSVTRGRSARHHSATPTTVRTTVTTRSPGAAGRPLVAALTATTAAVSQPARPSSRRRSGAVLISPPPGVAGPRETGPRGTAPHRRTAIVDGPRARLTVGSGPGSPHRHRSGPPPHLSTRGGGFSPQGGPPRRPRPSPPVGGDLLSSGIHPDADGRAPPRS